MTQNYDGSGSDARGWTKGPWSRDSDGDVVSEKTAVAFVWCSGEHEANARLIAAAPALYEALEAAKLWIGGLANENDSACLVYRQLVTALALARGEAA